MIGFLLLVAMSCGGIAMATGLGRINLSDLQSGSAAWTPPTLAPTPLASDLDAVSDSSTSSTAQDGSGASGFQAGAIVRNVTSSRVNVRASPGYLGKPDGDIIAQLLPGDQVELLGDRAVADNLNWWHVRVTAPNGVSVDGWVAEATASGVQILGSE